MFTFNNKIKIILDRRKQMHSICELDRYAADYYIITGMTKFANKVNALFYCLTV